MLRVLQTYRLDVYLFFIALASVMWLYLPSEDSFGVDQRLIVGACFLAGLVWIYLFNKTTDRVEDEVSQSGEMLSLSADRTLRRVLPLLIVIPSLVLWSISLPVWPYLVYILVGFLYSYPVYKHYRVKNVLFLKTFWAYIDMFLPFWFGLYVYFVPANNVLFLDGLVGFAFFYMVGELVWDIRDVEGDRASRVRTVPVVFGVLFTRVLGGVFLILGLLITPDHPMNYLVAGTLAVFLFCLHPRSPRHWFHTMLYIISALMLVGVWMELH